MSILLNKSDSVKVSTKGEGVHNTLNSVDMVCTQPLFNIRMYTYLYSIYAMK